MHSSGSDNFVMNAMVDVNIANSAIMHEYWAHGSTTSRNVRVFPMNSIAALCLISLAHSIVCNMIVIL